VWLLHKRLLSDESDPHVALMIQEELFEILWNDTTCRIRNQGVSELSVNRYLGKVQQYTFSHFFHYDHIYTSLSGGSSNSSSSNANTATSSSSSSFTTDRNNHANDVDDVDSNSNNHNDDDDDNNDTKDFTKRSVRVEELKNLVWIHFMQRDPTKRIDDHLDRLAWYIEAQYQNIMQDLPTEYYREGRIAWVNLPDFSNVIDQRGRILPDVDVRDDDDDDVSLSSALPEPWLANITLRGDYYYWNPITNETTWEKPIKK